MNPPTSAEGVADDDEAPDEVVGSLMRGPVVVVVGTGANAPVGLGRAMAGK